MAKNKLNFIMSAVTTIDGKIAKNSKHLTNWSSSEDKSFLRATLDKGDCIIIGRRTYELAHKALAKRSCLVFTSKVARIKKINNNCFYINPRRVDLIHLLESKHCRNINILGGTKTYSYFLQKDLINEMYLTIEPVIFGFGLSSFAGKTRQDILYTLKSVKKLNNNGTLLLHYKKR